jgi:hypothetical protein
MIAVTIAGWPLGFCFSGAAGLGQRHVLALGGRPWAHGWGEDQRWTLARAPGLAVRLFGVTYPLRWTSFPLRRLGYSPAGPRAPGRRARRGRRHTTLDQLEAVVRSRLRKFQRCPDLINAFLGQTGLTLDTLGHPDSRS